MDDPITVQLTKLKCEVDRLSFRLFGLTAVLIGVVALGAFYFALTRFVVPCLYS